MNRFLIVYNPNSSQYIHVKDEILTKATKIKGRMVGKFAIEKTSFEANTKRLIRVLRNGDFVLSAGGDATAAICANAILDSNKDVTLAVLPYGNFNDLARTLKTKTMEDVLQDSAVKKFYPLDVFIDGKHWRYATCYVTIGMTAEAVAIFDQPKIRKKMQEGHKSSWRSYIQLAKWYFKNRHKKQFLPDFKLNGKLQHNRASDYAAVNGSSMSRVMKGKDDYLKPLTFRSETERTTSFPRLFLLMVRSIFHRVPGSDTKGDTLAFVDPSTVALQAEGEYHTFENIRTIEVKKPTKYLKVIQK